MADVEKTGCLYVGEGVTLKGNFNVPDIATISGTIEGDLVAKQVLIESGGVVRGKLSAEMVDLRGEVVEHLTATRSLIIRSSGKAGGSIHYAEIEIEKGGSLHGDLHIIPGQGNHQS